MKTLILFFTLAAQAVAAPLLFTNAVERNPWTTNGGTVGSNALWFKMWALDNTTRGLVIWSSNVLSLKMYTNSLATTNLIGNASNGLVAFGLVSSNIFWGHLVNATNNQRTFITNAITVTSNGLITITSNGLYVTLKSYADAMDAFYLGEAENYADTVFGLGDSNVLWMSSNYTFSVSNTLNDYTLNVSNTLYAVGTGATNAVGNSNGFGTNTTFYGAIVFANTNDTVVFYALPTYGTTNLATESWASNWVSSHAMANTNGFGTNPMFYGTVVFANTNGSTTFYALPKWGSSNLATEAWSRILSTLCSNGVLNLSSNYTLGTSNLAWQAFTNVIVTNLESWEYLTNMNGGIDWSGSGEIVIRKGGNNVIWTDGTDTLILSNRPWLEAINGDYLMSSNDVTDIAVNLYTNSTNYAWVLATNATNYSWTLSTNATNYAWVLATNATNYAWTSDKSLLNAATNFALANGGTNVNNAWIGNLYSTNAVVTNLTVTGTLTVEGGAGSLVLGLATNNVSSQATNFILNVTNSSLAIIYLTNDCYWQMSTGQVVGWSSQGSMDLRAGGSSRTISFNTNWTAFGTVTNTLSANKRGIFSWWYVGTSISETNINYAFVVSP